MHSALKVILIIPLIGLLAGVLGNLELVASLFAFLFGIGKFLLIGIVGLWFLSAMLPRSEGSSSSSGDPEYLFPERDTPLVEGHVEHVDRNTKIMHADGYAFEMTNRFNGRLMWREVDPSTKQSIGSWTQAHPREAALKGEPRVMKEHITMKINKRKGIGN